jgi:hypothetical protein
MDGYSSSTAAHTWADVFSPSRSGPHTPATAVLRTLPHTGAARRRETPHTRSSQCCQAVGIIGTTGTTANFHWTITP